MNTQTRTLRGGFTLLELLVVLVILTILTVVAVHTVDGLQDQTRFEATQRGLREVEEAVLGPANVRQPDGSLLITGFVADMGRLPSNPSELWLKPDDALVFKKRTVGTVELFAGWRGPYLKMPVGGTLLDGWGKPFVITTTSWRVSSFGADNVDDSISTTANPYDADLSVELGDRWRGAITVNLFEIQGNTVVPINETATVKCYFLKSDGTVDSLDGTGGTTPQFITDVPIGLRVVQATRSTSPTTTAPVQVVVPPNGTATVNLVFR